MFLKSAKEISIISTIILLTAMLKFVKGCGPAAQGNKKIEGYPDCQFTRDLCDWININQLEWIVLNDTTYKNDSAISIAEPGNGSGYLTVDIDNRADYWRDKKAVLESPIITDPVCMEFLYHLHDGETGELKIESNIDRKKTTFFHHYGAHGSSWQTARLYINISGDYTIVITGTVGDHNRMRVPAIDDIKFSNNSCDTLPVASLNCTMRQSSCGWKFKLLSMAVEYDNVLHRYVPKLSAVHRVFIGKFNIESMWLNSSQHGCLRFMFRVERFGYRVNDLGKLFLFVVSENNELLPYWYQHLFYGIDWTQVEVEIRHIPWNKYKILIQGVDVLGYFYFRDFAIHTSSENCRTKIDKTFFVASLPAKPKQLSISDKSGYCSSPSQWYIKAQLVPSLLYQQPVFVYSVKDSLVMNFTRNDELFGHLGLYFYASTTEGNDTTAMNYILEDNGEHVVVTKLGNTGMTGNTIFVKDFGSVESQDRCEYGWVELLGGCYRLFCDEYTWAKASLECFREESELAPFRNDTMHVASDYLNLARVHLDGITTVSVALKQGKQHSGHGTGENYTYFESLPTQVRLVWDSSSKDWKVREIGENERSNVFLCRKISENIGYRQSIQEVKNDTTADSAYLMDDDSSTCYTLKPETAIWLKVDMGKSAALNRVRIIPSLQQRWKVPVHINVVNSALNVSLDTTRQRNIVVDKYPMDVIYDIPVNAGYIMLSSEEDVDICEIEIYASHEVRSLRGVSWSFGAMSEIYYSLKIHEFYQEYGHFFTVIPNFLRPSYIKGVYKESMQAYFMAPFTGNYSFLHQGKINFNLTVSTSRTSASSVKREWRSGALEQSEPAYFMKACTFYFVEVVFEAFRGDDFSLKIDSNDSFGNTTTTMNEMNLFWVLPGELVVDFYNGDDLISEIKVSTTAVINGYFRSNCVGFYCGYCSLAFFIHFAGHFECVNVQNQTAEHNGSLSLNLNKWISKIGVNDVTMGYQIDGDCSAIMRKSWLNVTSYTAVKVINKIDVKPIVLTSCLINLPTTLCSGDYEATYEGWKPVKLNQEIEYAFQSSHNISSWFSFGQFEKTRLIDVTGLCLRFLFKMDGNSSLTVIMRTTSGTRHRVWSLSGNHGDQWDNAWLILSSEYNDVAFTFASDPSHGNDTVMIANVQVITDQCVTGIKPYYAKPGYTCNSDDFQCVIGQCISLTQRCNREVDCVDGSDESGCDCLINEFECEDSGKCIPLSKVCDDKRNCDDGSDERLCDLCGTDKFYCPSGDCVHWQNTCNERWDCLDGSDEPDMCKKPATQGFLGNTTCRLNNLDCSSQLQDNSACKYFQGNCDFEDGFCGWLNMHNNHSSNWIINHGTTPSRNTGPQVDHTTRHTSGTYLYMEASPPSLPGNTSRLMGGLFQGGQSLCFSFYYHLYGEHIGKLNVYLTRDNSRGELLWSKSGMVDQYWHKALVTVDSSSDFMIIIEAVRGDGHLGDIAIDDISIGKGICTRNNEEEIIGSCSFDDVCSWKGVDDWKTLSDNTKPSTFLQDYFITKKMPFVLKKLVNDPLSLKYQCLSLWYSYDVTCNDTVVYFTQVLHHHNWTMSLFDLTENDDGKWKFGEVPLLTSQQQYTIILSGVEAENSEAECYLSLDELQFSFEPCSQIQNGEAVLARYGSYFYHGLATRHNETTTKVYFLGTSFVYQYYEDNGINRVIRGGPIILSDLTAGDRVVVDVNTTRAVAATVLSDCRKNDTVNGSNVLCNTSVLLDVGGDVLNISSERIWPLPVQLKEPGPLWLEVITECENSQQWGDVCYTVLNEANFYDTMDSCKQLGGRLLHSPLTNITTVPTITTYWLDQYTDYGLEDQTTVGNFSNSTTGNITGDGEALFNGFCTLFGNGHTRLVPCTRVARGICKTQSVKKSMFCEEKMARIHCTQLDSVINIHSAMLGQDVGTLYDCFNVNVSRHQNPCDFPDSNLAIKLKCDGLTSCDLEGAFNKGQCPSHIVYYDIKYSCRLPQEGKVQRKKQKAMWCPYGYTFFNTSCYKFVPTRKAWVDASSFCNLHHESKLVKVDSSDEEKFLSTEMKSVNHQTFWIGLNDRRLEGLLEWPDMTSVVYKNWRAGTMNFGSFDCVSLGFGGWSYAKCDTKYAFVCELEIDAVSCNFENDLCNWSSLVVGNASWLRENNVSRFENSSHSWVISLFHKKSTNWTRSAFVSQWISATVIENHGVCLKFAYHLRGNNTTLNIELESTNNDTEVLWKVRRQSDNLEGWEEGQVFLGIQHHFRVHFVGKLFEESGKIMVDDVFFEPGMCSPLPENAQEWTSVLVVDSPGWITSPYYPSFYMNNMKRTWLLEVVNGKRIRVEFLFFNLEDDLECRKDFLEFEDGQLNKKSMFLFCGSILPKPFVSKSESLKVTFKTNWKFLRTGFKLKYDVVQGENEECQFTDVLDCPKSCRCSRWLSNQTKISVAANDLYRVPLSLPQHTTTVFFDGGFITEMTDSDFSRIPDLEYLSLKDNRISILLPSTFSSLRNLKNIHLSQNILKYLPKGIFQATTQLRTLDLGGNRLKELKNGLFHSLRHLKTLSLRLNRLTSLSNDAFSGINNVEFLYLDGNKLSQLEDNVFENQSSLRVLHLQSNKLKIVKRKWLKKKTSLQLLKLNDNQVTNVQVGAFDDLRSLIELDLSGNKIEEIPDNLFEKLVSLQRLKVDHFTLCCHAKKQLPRVSCTSTKGGGVSSCDELLKNIVLKYSIWVLGILALLGNAAVVLYRVVKKDKNKVNSFLLTNLAVADLLMGVYLITLAYKSTEWSGVYFKHDFAWRSGHVCMFSGILATVSSEVSVLTLSLVTFDRLICLVFPFKFRRMSMKRALVLTALIWLIGSLIAFIPLLYDPYFFDNVNNMNYYGRSAVCLPFHLSNEKIPGWEYSAAIFLGLNGISFLFIVAAYIAMYRTITKASSAVRSTRMNKDKTLAKRMMLIILTDFFCWFPVIIINIMALTGVLHDPTKQVYAWIAVFVLPINSSLNPLLYTFSTVVGKSGARKSTMHSKSATDQSGKTTKDVISSSKSTSMAASMKTPAKTEVTKQNVIKRGNTPSVIHRNAMLNVAYEESPELTSDIEQKQKKYVLKVLENVGNTDKERNIKDKFLAFHAPDTDPTLVCIHVYDKGNTKCWENTKNLLSTIYRNENDPCNIVPCLWSAKANNVTMHQDSVNEKRVAPDDYLICYGQPSKETLHDLFQGGYMDIRTLLLVAKQVFKVIDHLTSINIVHNAICPQNIIVVRNSECEIVDAHLTGLSSAQARKTSSTFVDTEDFDDWNALNQSFMDIISFGEMLKNMLECSPQSFEVPEVHNIVELCLSVERLKSSTTGDILKQLGEIELYHNTKC